MKKLRLSFQNEDTSLSVRHFRIEEALSRLYRVEVEAVSPHESLDLATFVGHAAELQLSATHERCWRGLCVDMALKRVSDDAQGLATYSLVLVPSMWRLTQRRDNRLFQHISIPEIVDAILEEHNIPHRWMIAIADYPKLELRTQYDETDFDFVSRLLEEAGISFWFADPERAGDESLLVLGDAPQRNEPREGAPIQFVDEVFQAQVGRHEYVTDVNLRERSRPGRVTLRDDDFWRPSHKLIAQADSDRSEERGHEHYHHARGAFLREMTDPSQVNLAGELIDAGSRELEGVEASRALTATQTPVADDRAIARFDDAFGARMARRMVEALHSDRRVVSFESSVNDLRPGTVFHIGGHPHEEVSGEAGLLVTSFELEGEVAKAESWRYAGQAVHASINYRPARVTPRPRIFGMQTATVVGGGVETVPSEGVLSGLETAAAKTSQIAGRAANVLPGAVGAAASAVGETLGQAAGFIGTAAAHLSNQEIYVDEHGRVRVQFPWDRLNRNDSNSSIWMRVSQGWAGGGYGLFTIPRVGQEVLVSFIDGDPDRPLVVGAVHNVHEPVPYKLPENKTVSTWKTSSSPGKGGFNELRFDDGAGREHVYLQAEKDMDHLVKHDAKQAVGRDRARYVQRDESVAIGRDKTEFVNHNQVEATGLSRSEYVGVNRSTTVGVEDSTIVGSRWSVSVARGLTRRMTREMESIAGGLGGVMRASASGVLGMLPNDPLARAADAALTKFGAAAFGKLKNALSVLDGFAMDPGPLPTCIEMTDRQIKLTTGEASIVLDGPNVSITAQGAISLHSMKSISALAEEEVAIGGREKVAVVAATDQLILQSGVDLHLNPCEPGDVIEEATRLAGDTMRDMMRCGECGERLIENPDGWYCPNDPIATTPTE